MAHLMAIPIQDKGDAVLIVTECDGVTLMGFVTQSTLGCFFDKPPSICECMTFIERQLQLFERALLKKSMAECYIDTSIACVELTAGDLATSALDLTDVKLISHPAP